MAEARCMKCKKLVEVKDPQAKVFKIVEKK
jgi:hypothetical protein